MRILVVLLITSATGCNQLGSPCNSAGIHQECPGNQICRDGACVCGAVAATRQLGESCAETDCVTCIVTLLCNRAVDSCQQPNSQTEGQPCSETSLCIEGLICNTHGSVEACEPPHSRGDGEPCSSRENCVEGLTCHVGEGPKVCEPLGGEGAECFDDADCRPGLVCNSYDVDTCRYPGSVGDPCTQHEDCEAGLVCDGSSVPPACAMP